MLRDDLTQHCSLLHKFLQLCVTQKKRERAGGVLSLIIAMLAKMTNQRSRLVQTVLSLILLAGHATKQVSMIDVCILHVYVVAHVDSIHRSANKHNTHECIFHPADTAQIAPSNANCPPEDFTERSRSAAVSLLAGH